MHRVTRLTAGLLLALSIGITALAQDGRADDAGSRTVVTATATSDRVRIAAPNAVVQLRLEIYDDAGQKLLDTEQRGGNVLDWHLQLGNGQRVADGTYLCVVTIKNLSGRLSQKLALTTVSTQSATLRSTAVAELNLRQAQAIGPIEGDEGLTVMPPEDAQPVTVLANNDGEAQLARTRGALSFRVGDFFSGNDEEQMRLTEEGNLGIGTDSPQAKLDVAGVIRTSKGIEFANATNGTNGTNVTKLTTTATGSLQQTLADGTVVPNATGTGTQDRLAKWTDNAGTLGDSLLNESGSGIEMRPTAAGPGVNPTIVNNNSLAGFSQFQFYPVVGPNANMSFAVIPRGTGVANNRAQFSIFGTDLLADLNNYEFASLRARGPDFVFGTGKSGTGQNRPFMFAAGFLSDNTTNNGQLYLATNGNVGIGTTSPQALFNVNGNVRWGGTTTNFVYSGEDGSGLFLEQSGSSSAKSKIRLQSSKSGDLSNYSQIFIDPNNGFSFMSLGTGNGNVGIGTATPRSKLDVRGNIQLGNGGQYFATGGEENLRIVRGSIAIQGDILEGAGFHVSHPQTGAYYFTVDTPFSGPPTVTAMVSDANNSKIWIFVDLVTNSSFRITTYDDAQQLDSQPFHFIAVGPR